MVQANPAIVIETTIPAHHNHCSCSYSPLTQRPATRLRTALDLSCSCYWSGSRQGRLVDGCHQPVVRPAQRVHNSWRLRNASRLALVDISFSTSCSYGICTRKGTNESILAADNAEAHTWMMTGMGCTETNNQPSQSPSVCVMCSNKGDEGRQRGDAKTC